MKRRRTRLWAAASLGLCALLPLATLHAQAPAAEAPASTPTAAAVSEPERLYHLAFVALADGDHALAHSMLQELIAKHPESALADRARNVVALLEQPESASSASPSPSPTQAPPAPASAEAPEAPPPASPTAATDRGPRPTAAARAELVFVQTVYGLALGAELCLIAGCDDERAAIGLMMAGAGTGFGISYVASREGIAPGLARALTDGALWGLANGVMIMIGTDVSEDVDDGAIVGAHLALGQLAGLGVAGLLYSQLEPSTGQVSLTSSGGIWSLALTAQLLGAIDADLDEQTWALALLAASDLGLAAGAVLAVHHPMSASRVLMIDASGLLGGLLGLGIGVLVQDDPELTPTLTMGLVGTASGLGLSYYLTRSWDDDEGARDSDTRASLSLVPVRGGAMALANLRY